MRQLKTTDDVITALGGPAEVKVLTRAKNLQAVHNWKERGFPARLFALMTAELGRRKCAAPASLWGQEPVRPATSAPERHAV